MSMSLEDILTLKCALLGQVELEKGISFEVSIEIAPEYEFPQDRDFAYTDGNCIYFSPKILSAPYHRVDGLLRHELAHALLLQKGVLLHSEQDADYVAAWAFGMPILYDVEDVQSTLVGCPVRPSHLPK